MAVPASRPPSQEPRVGSAAVLILLRHGRTASNASRRLLGRMDVPLDELGRRQAKALGQSDVVQQAARVVSSPLRRALDTAAALGRPVTVDERWTEIDYGVYDGRQLDQVPDLFRQWGRDIGFVPDGGESLLALGHRVRAACEDLWAEAVDHDVVVVSHVSPIKAAVAWALGVDDESSWRMFVDVASVTCIGPGRPGAGLPTPSLRLFNDTHQRPSS
jgi:alpha-ribazole phosphatase